MSLQTFLQYLADAMFLVIFGMVLSKAIRFRRKTLIHASLLFGDAAVVVIISLVLQAVGQPSTSWFALVSGALLLALPYPLIQLVDDAAGLSPWTLRLFEAGFVLSVAGLVAFSEPRPVWLTVLQVAYFVGATYYSAVAFARAAVMSRGVTRRRMQAVALGSLFLSLYILVAGMLVLLPQFQPQLTILAEICPIVCGVGYYIGFSPPRWLQRAWQEPELRAFLSKAASLPRLPDTLAIVRELERGARESFGTPIAAIGLWREEQGVLEFQHHPFGHKESTSGSDDDRYEYDVVHLKPGDAVTGKAFAAQHAVSSFDLRYEEGNVADLYRSMGIQCVLAAPISAGERRIGVLGVYGVRHMVFAEDDLALTSLLADQAAVILESRALIDEATRVQAREKAAEMETDFLSAAAHEFRTPLTTLLGSGQLLQRRARNKPELAPHMDDINAIVRQAQRMRSIVSELLDASRIDHGTLLDSRTEVDLVALAREVCSQHGSGDLTRFSVTADTVVLACCDSGRMMQVLENLVQNAVKYSPEGGDINVRVWSDLENAYVSVQDHGIGIAAEDLPHIFSRFSRGRNINHRKYVGLGLGLFIAHGIVEEHGGSMSVTSRLGEGTTIQLSIPIVPPQAELLQAESSRAES